MRSSASPAPRRVLGHVLALAATATVLTAAVVLVGFDGWTYYRTPVTQRGLSPAHQLLRPSGSVGLALGVSGLAAMSVMHLYSLRKRWRALAKVGNPTVWLEFHIFCGIVGPIFITFHTSFKFNGIVSVAYWSMVIVALSGFVGRYLYVRIPKTLRGQELTRDELEAQATSLRRDLLASPLPLHLLRRLEEFEKHTLPAVEQSTTWGGMLFGEFGLRRRLAVLRRELRTSSSDTRVLECAIDLVAERAVLLRRIAYLRKTKKLFELWHVFHQPLAAVMFVIVTLHVATALYFGYAFGSH